MNEAKLLEAIRRRAHRPEGGGDFQFIQDCLSGLRGERAKTAAEGAILTSVEMCDEENDERIADHLVETVGMECAVEADEQAVRS